MVEETIHEMPNTQEYEIETTKRKLFLVPVSAGKRRLFAREKAYVTVNAKLGMMQLGMGALAATGMSHNWYKLAFDSGNRVIAWKTKNALDKGEMEEKAWKFCKPSESNKSYQMSIKRILDTFDGLKKQSYKKLEIKQYKDPKSILDNDTYYYVELPQE